MDPINVSAIMFNHNPNSCTHDALTIRRNYTTPVSVPEWTKGMVTPEESRAAYAIRETTGNTITIKVRFAVRKDLIPTERPPKIPPDTKVTVKIRAIRRGRMKNVLWDVKEKTVTFDLSALIRKQPYIEFELENTGLATTSVGIHTVTWIWQYMIVARGRMPAAWVTFDTTAHRIYTVLEAPRTPWLQAPPAGSETQLPWTDVLDYACAWASGATTLEDAACKVTTAIYNLGPQTVTYDCPGWGGSHYSSGNFACTKFIERLKGGIGNGYYVNCSDCATFVSSFANILGCDLWQSRMGSGFGLKPLLGIGSTVCQTACGWSGFSYHEVAWTGACLANDRVYDACLKVDCATSPPNPVLPCNMRFGNCGDGDYRDRLATAATCQNCAPLPGTRTRRVVV